jgi:DNA-binding transcriptional ArsR family regulator
MTGIPIAERREQTRMRITRALEEDAEQQRQRIVEFLERGPSTVEVIAELLGLAQAQVRTRLMELRDAGEVTSERKGEMTSRYRLVQE